MSRFKAFLCSLLCSLLCFVPLCLLALQGQLAASPATAKAEKVPVDTPRPGDYKNILLVVQNPDPAFLLFRFDGMQNCVNGAVFPKDTVVLLSGKPVTLEACYQAAGPAQARDALGETFSLRIDNYFDVPVKTLSNSAAGFGAVRMGMNDFGQIKNLESLKQFVFDGGESDVSPAAAMVLVRDGGLEGEALASLRAKLYQNFLRAAPAELSACFTGAAQASGTLTDLTATEAPVYQRIFSMFKHTEPDVRVRRIPGIQTKNGYELNEESAQLAEEFFI
ncbi:MAG: hypothetical protein Q4G07_07805 [Oscillospiraceae bacterium]|nr:hypothetical protein [Oscillospiraceae bacterium]